MTRPRVRLARTLGVGLVAVALCAGTVGTAAAAPNLPDPIAAGPSTPKPPTIE